MAEPSELDPTLVDSCRLLLCTLQPFGGDSIARSSVLALSLLVRNEMGPSMGFSNVLFSPGRSAPHSRDIARAIEHLEQMGVLVEFEMDRRRRERNGLDRGPTALILTVLGQRAADEILDEVSDEHKEWLASVMTWAGSLGPDDLVGYVMRTQSGYLKEA